VPGKWQASLLGLRRSAQSGADELEQLVMIERFV
jgi:hypothetical protein